MHHCRRTRLKRTAQVHQACLLCYCLNVNSISLQAWGYHDLRVQIPSPQGQGGSHPSSSEGKAAKKAVLRAEGGVYQDSDAFPRPQSSAAAVEDESSENNSAACPRVSDKETDGQAICGCCPNTGAVNSGSLHLFFEECGFSCCFLFSKEEQLLTSEAFPTSQQHASTTFKDGRVPLSSTQLKSCSAARDEVRSM